MPRRWSASRCGRSADGSPRNAPERRASPSPRRWTRCCDGLTRSSSNDLPIPSDHQPPATGSRIRPPSYTGVRMEPPDFDVPEDDEAELAAIAEAFVALRDVAYRYAQTGKLPDDLPDELVPLITQFSRVLTGELTLGDLTPSEEELNEDPELEAWWAGVGPPPAQTLTAARMQTAAPLIAPPR